MDKRRVSLWAVLIGTSLMSAYSLWPARAPRRATRTPAAAAPAGSTAAPAAVASATAVRKSPRLTEPELAAWRRAQGVTQRDPFFTRAETAGGGRGHIVRTVPPIVYPEYTVKFVMAVGSERMALIGDEVLKVGDTLGDERIAQILPDLVVLERAGERRELFVGTDSAVAQPVKERVR